MQCEPAQLQIEHFSRAQHAEAKVFQHSFAFMNHIITHQNKFEVQIVPTRAQNLEVKNYFCRLDAEALVKTTEILIEDRVIKISDYFQAKQIFPTSKQRRMKKEHTLKYGTRLQLLQKRGRRKDQTLAAQETHRARDTKNVVKNLINIFNCWLAIVEEPHRSARPILNTLIAKEKFNNNLILEIAKQPSLRKAFIVFTELCGQSAISRSKINDKACHEQALNKYYRICIQNQSLGSKPSEQFQLFLPATQPQENNSIRSSLQSADDRSLH